MKSNLAIATLIRSRMTMLGLSRGEFAKRLGYKNIYTSRSELGNGRKLHQFLKADVLNA
jgi:hypothetical protein